MWINNRLIKADNMRYKIISASFLAEMIHVADPLCLVKKTK